MKQLVDFLSEDDVRNINEYFDTAKRRHPAWSALNVDNQKFTYDRAPKDYLTKEAIHLICSKIEGETWLKEVLKRVTQVANFEEAVSALAEIRCYGAMLSAGFWVGPLPTGSTPTPDFEFKLDGVTGVIEVAAKLEHDDQVKMAKQIAVGDTPKGVERLTKHTKRLRIDIVVSEGHPFGAPNVDKAGDTTQTNAISRICSIKAKETQLEPGKPSLLWIDFRDMGRWPAVLSPEQAFPLISGRDGILCSGAIWYAFFGSVGLPVFDSDWGGRQIITPMAHFGRFHPQAPKISGYSAAIFCLDKATILFENPAAAAPLTDSLRAALTRLPRFELAHSIVNWQSGHIDQAITVARTMIDVLHNNRTTEEW
ncbi:hypothetical protein [Komagataeibacter europaeus]|uniref:hypothetical protein n=1 Tax=Komagataeibacter europaeus TaxID=33995 RepID=UPI0002E30F27|nr:hypothetical protein [Komagataeibacter europaeus]GBQ40844.1 hypothetical protein AA18890_0946 [Komagataeibacter europaeus LMG 18890]